MPESELMRELHANLWGSLRHVFNTDRVLLAVLYVTNLAGFVMLANVTHTNRPAAVVAVVAMILLSILISLALNNSKREVLALVRTLVDVYEDHGLAKYFDKSKLEYYRRRYTLWEILVPAVAVVAIVLGWLVGAHS